MYQSQANTLASINIRYKKSCYIELLAYVTPIIVDRIKRPKEIQRQIKGQKKRQVKKQATKDEQFRVDEAEKRETWTNCTSKDNMIKIYLIL